MSPEKLGQHFLTEQWQERIAEEIHIRAGSVWVEIGGGHGEMTARLAERAGKVIVIELDRKLIPSLRHLARAHKNIEVIESDMLAVDFETLAGGERFSVYGNLPYYITSPILHRLFERADRIAAIHVVIQLEVAARIVAAPGRRDYGYLSVASQWYGEPEMVFKIPPGAFQPPPKVESALVSFAIPGAREKYCLKEETDFLDFVKECFAQKRKTLRNNLRGRLGNRVDDVLREAGLQTNTRAEQLAISDFVTVFKLTQPGF